MTKALTIGLLGLGNVGKGVADLLQQNAHLLERRLGHPIRLKTALVRSLNRVAPPGVHLTTSPDDILDDPDIDVVVEVMGGENPAFGYISKAIQCGKYVVTANKEVISKHKKQLFNLAIHHQVDLFYEAAVGGGIPLIRTLKVGLAANRIESIVGILNGTTNYILTQMIDHKMAYRDALTQAQSLGFAEPDPTMDVSGLDTAYKLSILASVALKADIGVTDFVYQGIDTLDSVDISYAVELGYTIKLLAVGRLVGDGRLALSVQPTLLPVDHPLALVRNEYNAIYVLGNAVGESMLMGRGAGSFPTASAIVSDLIDIAFDLKSTPSNRNLDNEFGEVSVVPRQDMVSQVYLRLRVHDASGMLAHVGAVFEAHQMSIAQLIQKEKQDQQAELVIITHLVSQHQVQQVRKALLGLEGVTWVSDGLTVGIDS